MLYPAGGALSNIVSPGVLNGHAIIAWHVSLSPRHTVRSAATCDFRLHHGHNNYIKLSVIPVPVYLCHTFQQNVVLPSCVLVVWPWWVIMSVCRDSNTKISHKHHKTHPAILMPRTVMSCCYNNICRNSKKFCRMYTLVHSFTLCIMTGTAGEKKLRNGFCAQ